MLPVNISKLMTL